jgi:GWxTD domain-containing protein
LELSADSFLIMHRPPPFVPLVLAALGCGGGAVRGADERVAPAIPDAIATYRRMGLLAAGGGTPFVGSGAFLAGPAADSTHVLLTGSLPRGALTFAREGSEYRASYAVTLALRDVAGARPVRSIEGRDLVRVASLRETVRHDESVIFQQMARVAPGSYAATLTVRDEGGTKRSSADASIAVSRLGAGGLSSPVAVRRADPRASVVASPAIVALPRATATFGVDSSVSAYVEAYGVTGERVPLTLTVRDWSNERESGVVWRDTTSLARRGSDTNAMASGVLRVSVSRIGVGALSLEVRRDDTRDSSAAPLFVTFGDELPVASFAAMLDDLRYFASEARIAALRSAPAERRGVLWAEFLEEAESWPAAAERGGMRGYFARIARANVRFRDESSVGWLTDRGRVLVALGDPDDESRASTHLLDDGSRVLVWRYHGQRLELAFVDRSGFGRWMLTPTSEAAFVRAMRPLLVP